MNDIDSGIETGEETESTETVEGEDDDFDFDEDSYQLGDDEAADYNTVRLKKQW